MHPHRARFPEDPEPQGRLPSESAIPDDLAVALSAAVPLHIEELGDLDPEILAAVAHTAAPVVGSTATICCSAASTAQRRSTHWPAVWRPRR
ncbi:hypothetical protein LIX60_30595 [Streptomyces sp. S07_1.15]|uniref:hypothetical protein n=1 Tax=Streptomyces sp. S07_1.15 TaxID=2873925 RepID=UPI001D1598D9|nr:hypothetical protein [Streptomyces sp. S07_1.15]MCC3655732.1 hypothetical protein [Streptomyces sp. S07_1.15]